MEPDQAAGVGGLADETILGLDNVQLELPISGLGSRSLAAFVDYFLLALLTVGWLVVSISGLAWLETGGGWMLAVVLLGLFALNWGYFAGFEILLWGKTPGKMLMSLRVVTRNGGKPGIAAFIIRSFVRPIDMVIGVPLMAMDSLARRLGDRLAGTIVVHEPKERSEIILQRLPSGWGAREAAYVESFLGRVEELRVDRAEVLTQRLLTWIDRDDPDFLEGVTIEADPVATLRKAFLGRAT